MKKYLFIVLTVLLLVLAACNTNQGDTDMPGSDDVIAEEITVTFVNDVEDADIWILPQTEENLKTTLWGTPTLDDSAKGATGTCCIDGGAEKYIVRIIDTDGAYFAANDLVLHEGWTVRLTTDTDRFDATLAVLDDMGSVINEKDGVFEGMLG